jgi:hypothetical protein
MCAHRQLMFFCVAVVAVACGCAQTAGSASSQGTDPHAKLLLQAAVQSELASDADTQRQETQHIMDFVRDPSAQAKERKSVAHDDEQAAQLLRMLPDAFIWTLKSETAEYATLTYRPNDDFRPPSMEARVMGTMAGEMVIAKADNRIRTLRGALSDDVRFGFGIFGKLRRGGTFDIERREIAPHIWQITESRVHIGGRALLFKNIGQQEDEIKSDWKPSTAKTLEEAAKQLGAG